MGLYASNRGSCRTTNTSTRSTRSTAMFFFLAVLLLTISFQATTAGASRPFPRLPFLNPQRYMKLLATLGIWCRCCDGSEAAGGGRACREATAASERPCEKLVCRPWKFF